MTKDFDKEDHEPEKGFSEKVEDYLIDEYGEENVEGQVYVEDSGRYVDFKVQTPLDVRYIEVENDFEACFKGVGQGLVYSHNEMGSTPLIIVPQDHVEFPEAEALNEHVTILQLDL